MSFLYGFWAKIAFVGAVTPHTSITDWRATLTPFLMLDARTAAKASFPVAIWGEDVWIELYRLLGG